MGESSGSPVQPQPGGSNILARTAWSCESLVVSNATLIAAISGAASGGAGFYELEELSATAWSFAHRGCLHAPLLDALASQARRTLHGFDVDLVADTSGAGPAYGLIWGLWRHAAVIVVQGAICNDGACRAKL